jgi:hypothetical protein
MELYHLHPLFEFFLVFYAGYLVSNELKRVIDEKVINLLRDYTKEINEHIEYLLSQISKIRDNKDNLFLLVKTIVKDKKSYNAFMNSNDSKISKLTEIEYEISQKYDSARPENLFRSEIQFTNVFKSYSLFFAFYCFAILYINAFPLFANDINFRFFLFIFNTLSFLFIVLIFLISLRNKETMFNSKYGEFYVACLFGLFIIVSSIIAHYCVGGCGDWIKDWSVHSSLILLVLPILAYILRIPISGRLLKSRLKEEKETFCARIVIIKDELPNFEKLIPAIKQFKDATEGTTNTEEGVNNTGPVKPD